VKSIEGSRVLSNLMASFLDESVFPASRARRIDTINEHGKLANIGNITLDYSKLWSYYNYAFSDTNGTATFTVQGNGTKYSPGFEGGKIQDQFEKPEKSEIVPMITVDQFVEIFEINDIDVLKIDAEGRSINPIQ
jgi:FkbM family methyltransferase